MAKHNADKEIQNFFPENRIQLNLFIAYRLICIRNVVMSHQRRHFSVLTIGIITDMCYLHFTNLKISILWLHTVYEKSM